MARGLCGGSGRLATLAFAVALSACGGSSLDPANRAGGGDGTSGGDGRGNGDSDTSNQPLDIPELAHSTGGRSWTVLVYMVADNDLEPFALQDLTEMMAVGGSDDFNIIVQVDRATGYTNGAIGGLPDWTGTLRVRVDSGKLTKLQDIGEKNMGDPTVLADFLTWGIENYPADKIALVFWDHGSAWPGFGADMSHNWDGLTLAELQTGMAAGLSGAGRDRVTLVGFDACLMGSLESALALRDYAEYLLASEELEPGHGWDYAAFADAAENPSLDAIAVSKAMMAGFRAQSISQNTSYNITLSLVDLYNLRAVERALSAMGDAFDPTTPSLVTLFGRARGGALEFGRQASVQDSALMVDLAGVASVIADAGGPIAAAAETLIEALDAAVLDLTNGTATAAATGISVYWPPYRTLYDTDYDAVPAIAVWRTLLTSVQSATGGSGGGQFTSPTAAKTAIAGGGVRLSGTLSNAGGVVAEGMYYGLKVGSRYFVLGDTFGTISGSTVSADWDAKALLVSQGAVSDYCYFSYQQGDNGTMVATIPFGYSATGNANALDTALLMIVYGSSGNVQQQTMYLSTAAGYGQLTPAYGSKLYPVYAEMTGSEMSWGATTTELDATSTISMSFEKVSTSPADRVAFGVLYATDYSGDEAWAIWEGDL